MTVPAREAKPATGAGSAINIVWAGDSIGDGQGGQTAAGALPAYVQMWDDGVSLATWPSGNPPGAGHLYQLAADLNAAGYETVRIFRRALSAQEADVTIGNYLRNAVNDCRANGYTVHLVGIVMTTNDCQDEAEYNELEYRLTSAYRQVQWSCPAARIFHLEPAAAASGSHLFVDETRSLIRSLTAAISGAAAVRGDDISTGDGTHPDVAGFNTQASRITPLYQAMS